jgi:hypothetical protein
MSEPALQAASIRATAKAFSVPARLFYSAVQTGDLGLYHSTGRRGVLLFDEVREFLRKRPAPSRAKKSIWE